MCCTQSRLLSYIHQSALNNVQLLTRLLVAGVSQLQHGVLLQQQLPGVWHRGAQAGVPHPQQIRHQQACSHRPPQAHNQVGGYIIIILFYFMVAVLWVFRTIYFMKLTIKTFQHYSKAFLHRN